MPKLPDISGEVLIKILERKGYQFMRTRGSHARLYPPPSSTLRKVTVPLHPHVAKGTLARIMKDAELTINNL